MVGQSSGIVAVHAGAQEQRQHAGCASAGDVVVEGIADHQHARRRRMAELIECSGEDRRVRLAYKAGAATEAP